MSSKSEDEVHVKLKNRLWRRLTKRVNRKNIMRLATLFRRLIARAFCMRVDVDKTATAELECANEERETQTEGGSSDDDDANRASTDRVESPTADQDGSMDDSGTESETPAPRIEEECTDSTVPEMKKAPVCNKTRAAALRQLQRQIFMDDTFTTAKPPLPPRRRRVPGQCTRLVHGTRSLDRVHGMITAAPSKAEVAEAEVVPEKQEVTTTEEVTEKPVEEMTDEDIDDIIDEILRC